MKRQRQTLLKWRTSLELEPVIVLDGDDSEVAVNDKIGIASTTGTIQVPPHMPTTEPQRLELQKAPRPTAATGALAVLMAAATQRSRTVERPPQAERFILNVDDCATKTIFSWRLETLVKVPAKVEDTLAAPASSDQLPRQLGVISLQLGSDAADAAAGVEVCCQGRWLSRHVSVELVSNLPATHHALRARAHALRAPRTRLSKGVLQSLLQKAVRRGRNADVVRPLAAELWRCNAEAAVRRLLVIMVEDALLHPAAPLLVWMMLARAAATTAAVSSAPGSDPFCELGAAFEAAYIRIACEMAACAWRDLLVALPDDAASETAGGEARAIAAVSTSAVIGVAQDPGRCCAAARGVAGAGVALVWSLLARRAFGGSKGDKDMLARAAGVWARRLATRPLAWLRALNAAHAMPGCAAARYELAKPAYDCEAAEAPTLERLPLAGVDQHCRPDMVEALLFALRAPAGHLAPALLADSAGDRAAVISVIHDALWCLRGGVNVRLPLPSLAAVTDRAPPQHMSEAAAEHLARKDFGAIPAWWDALRLAADAWARAELSARLRS